MSFIKWLYPKNSLKYKIISIEEGIERLVRQVCEDKFWVEWYGAFDINPANLTFWICVQSDLTKQKLLADTALMGRLRNLLEIHAYPSEARDKVYIGFESQETVDRESDGDWYVHFK